MPTTIPVIQDSARLDTDTGRQRIQASPDAYGAQEGRALGEVKRGLDTVAQVADEVDERFARANALELDNELTRRIRDRLYNTNDGYLSTQRGRNALDVRGEVEADIDRIAVELAGTARGARAEAFYTQAARARVTDALGSIATHAANQSRVYENEQSEGRIQEAMDNAVAAYADPASVAANLAVATGEISRVAEREGWGEDATRSRIRQLQSDITARTIVSLASTDPQAAEELYMRARPHLSAQEAGALLTTMRMAQQQGEDEVIDEAWVYVSNGQRVPPELWSRVPGRARIDIQNEIRRRAEGGSGVGDRFVIDSLDVMDDDDFARVDLMSIRGALGSSFQRMAARQRGIRDGTQDVTINQQRETFNALVATAENALAPYGVDLSITEGMRDDERRRAVAFRRALQRELEAHQAAGGGRPTAEEAQILIGRAVVSLRRDDVPENPNSGRTPGGLRVEGRRGRNQRSAVAPTTESVMPYDAIEDGIARRIGTRLQRRLGRTPTRGEVENAYAALLAADPRTPAEVDQVFDRILRVGGGE